MLLVIPLGRGARYGILVGLIRGEILLHFWQRLVAFHVGHQDRVTVERCVVQLVVPVEFLVKQEVDAWGPVTKNPEFTLQMFVPRSRQVSYVFLVLAPIAFAGQQASGELWPCSWSVHGHAALEYCAHYWENPHTTAKKNTCPHSVGHVTASCMFWNCH